MVCGKSVSQSLQHVHSKLSLGSAQICCSSFCWKFKVCNKIHHPVLAAECDGNPFPLLMTCEIWSAQVHVMLFIGRLERAGWKDPLMLLFKHRVL